MQPLEFAPFFSRVAEKFDLQKAFDALISVPVADKSDREHPSVILERIDLQARENDSADRKRYQYACSIVNKRSLEL